MIITITRSDVLALNNYVVSVKDIINAELPEMADKAPTFGHPYDFGDVDFLDLEQHLQAKFNPEAVTFMSYRGDTIEVEINSAVFEKLFAIALRYVRLYAKLAGAINTLVNVAKPLYETLVKPRLEATQKEMDNIQEDAMAFAIWMKVAQQPGGEAERPRPDFTH